MSCKECTDPFDLGYEAYWADEDFDECPYEDDADADEWETGWEVAQDEDEAEANDE